MRAQGRTERALRLEELRERLGGGQSLSESLLRGCLALLVGPWISPSASLRFRVEFQRFLMALSVLHSMGAQWWSASVP